jgi:serine/threonine protein kinase
MLNRKSSNNRKHKVIKVLQVEDLKIGYLNKYPQKEEYTEVKEGQTLEEYTKDRNFLESKDVYSITVSICETIANLNSLNCSIMCSQLNPTNIMVTKNKKIFIKDFGFSKGLQVNDKNSMYILSCKNTYEKQHRFEKVSREKVIYTIGMLMYFMATGKAPITMLDPLLEDSYGNNIDSNLKRIIQKCFDIDIKRRYVSIEELNKEIIIELLTKSKYRKIEDLSSCYNDSGKPLEHNRLKRVDKRKSKRNLSSVLSKISATLSTIFLT